MSDRIHIQAAKQWLYQMHANLRQYENETKVTFAVGKDIAPLSSMANRSWFSNQYETLATSKGNLTSMAEIIAYSYSVCWPSRVFAISWKPNKKKITNQCYPLKTNKLNNKWDLSRPKRLWTKKICVNCSLKEQKLFFPIYNGFNQFRLPSVQ